MKSKLYLITLFILVLLIISCGGTKQKVSTQTESESPCPDWFTTVPEDPDFLYSAATTTSKDLQFAINKAKQLASLDIGNQMERQLSGLTKQFMEEVGEGEDSELVSQFTTVSKSVVSTNLSGCKAKYQTTKKEGSVWRACILMQYPIGEANAQFLESLKKQRIIEQRIRATDAFEELEKEVEKYKQEKNK